MQQEKEMTQSKESDTIVFVKTNMGYVSKVSRDEKAREILP